MSTQSPCVVLVVGAGTMGAGIAQIAAQAGHEVRLYDARDGAVIEAKARLSKSLGVLVGKGRLSEDAVEGALARILPITSLEEARDAGLVVEAIVENLEIKRSLLCQIERLVREDAILASNTSSISITAMARGLVRPERLVGMHFFNPVPVMKLVEVVSGLHTEPEVAERVFELAVRWGKTPVHARSTPGFIVNRIARPFYAESLALLHERMITPAVLDACMRSAGFRMGPCELMDLIGHDTNFAVTETVFNGNFTDKRYVPSLVQRDLVDGGLLGRKSGRGFYDYADDTVAPRQVEQPGPRGELPPAAPFPVVLHGAGALVERWAELLLQAGRTCERRMDSQWSGLEEGGGQLRLTDGRMATQLSAEFKLPDIAVFDLVLAPTSAEGALAYAVSESASDAWGQRAAQWLRHAGFTPQPMGDAPGLVVARTLAMLVNEAADAVLQGVCTPQGADTAMRLGVNYPAGPFQWLQQWSAQGIAQLLGRLNEYSRSERYRVSPWLQQRAWHEVLLPVAPV